MSNTNGSVLEQLVALIGGRGLASDATINPFWQEQMRDLKGGGELTAERIRSVLRYGVQDLPDGASNKDLPEVSQLLKAIKDEVIPAQKALKDIFHRASHAEHAKCLLALSHYKLADEYLRS